MKLTRSTLACSVVLVSSLVACGKKQEPAGGDPAKTAPAPTPAPAKQAFTGPLTIKLLMDSAREIKIYTPDGKPSKFEDSLAAAKFTLGEPTHVDGDTYEWGVIEGDRCGFYKLSNKGGIADSPGSMGTDTKDVECMTAAGKSEPAGAAGSGSAAAAGSGSGSAAAADDLCATLEKVIADGGKQFATVGDATKPADAKSAAVETGALGIASWTATWDGSGTAAERLDPLKARVLACSFAKDLKGDGKPHATEKDSPADAIDWTLDAQHLGIELLAEGASGVTLSVATEPAK